MKRLLLLVLAVTAFGCAAEAIDETNIEGESDLLAIVGGTTRRDEASYIAQLRLRDGGACTATLIGRRTILTAAHCFAFQSRGSTSTSGHRYTRTSSDGSASYSINILRFESLGTKLGRDDIAVAELETDAPTRLNPRRIWTAEPPKGMPSTVFGFGCENPAWNSTVPDWVCPRGSFGVMRYLNLDWQGLKVSSPDGAMGPIIAHGDSGGPVMSNAQIAAVSSSFSTTYNKKSGAVISTSAEFASVWRHQAAINRLIDTYGR